MAAEKRQLAILNCDLVDSTVLAEELDPESFESLIQSFIDLSIDIVDRNHGVFATNTGDGFEAYFYPGTGLPAASYAIECALDIQHALQSRNLNSEQPLLARVGVATGQVVLSPHKLSSATEELIPFGRPVHLAARLQTVAEPGNVVVDDATHESVETYFNFSNIGEQSLKGFNQPVGVWQVDGRRPWESRFEVRLPTLSPLVGRDTEIDLLLEHWQAVDRGEGQGVVVIGEPGIGKSRLVYEVTRRINQYPINLQCLENFENTPLHPWTRFYESAAEIRPRDTLAQRKKKLDQLMDREFALDERHRRILLALLAYDPDSELQDDSTAKQQLEELCMAIASLFLQRAKHSPQFIVLEDVHWIDPTSKVLLDILWERIADTKVFILMTSRPEKLDDLRNSKVSSLTLNRLTHNQTMTLAMSGMAGIPEKRVREIVRWTDGIPLFVEEIAKTTAMAAENGQSEGPGVSKEKSRGLEIPNSLQELLLARLDRLGDAKEVAQVASVVGREFNREVLAPLKNDQLDAIDRALAVLVESGIVVVRDTGLDNYSFKHALIQDVVYKNLLDRDAIKLHGRLAEIYQHEYPDMRNARPEIIAYHLTLSKNWEKAAEYWLAAGIAARSTGSNMEALGRLEQGLAAARELDDSLRAKKLRSQLLMIRGEAIIAHYGPVNREGQDAFEEAVKICEEIGDEANVISSQTSLMWLRFDLGEFPTTQSTANKLTGYAKKMDNHQAAAVGLLGSGMCRFAMGQFQDAQDSLQESLDYLEHGIEPIEGYPGKAYTYMGLIKHIIGEPEKGLELCRHAIDVTADHSPYDLVAALGNSLYLNVMQHRLDHMEETSRRLMHLANEAGFIKWYYQGVFFLGGVYAARKEPKGLKMMEDAISRFEQARELVELSIFYGLVADRYLMNGNLELAHHWVDKALALVETYGERFVEVPLVRLKARCIEDSEAGDSEVTRNLLLHAERTAQQQGALAWQASTQPAAGYSWDEAESGCFP